MRLRSRQTHRFEIYTPRNQTVRGLHALAKTGTIELEVNPKINAALEVKKVYDTVQEFDRLARQFHSYLPHHELHPAELQDDPEHTANLAIAIIRDWAGKIEPIDVNLQALETERDNLVLLGECLTVIQESHQNLALLAHEDGLLFKGLFACPKDKDLKEPLLQAFQEVVAGPQHQFMILIDLPEHAPLINSAIKQGACYRVDIPDWLTPESEDWDMQTQLRVEAINGELAALQHELDALNNEPRLDQALANMALLRWYIHQAPALTEDQKFCHITGWTTDTTAMELETVLRTNGVQGIVRFLDFPSERSAPIKTLDTWWARPFQPFLTMYGTPGESEVDPSALLVFVIPLLFGYMFPDVGHGLVLVVISAVLFNRWPEGRFLLPCGFAAVFFGFVFGDVFGFHDVIQPLWLKPMEQPMTVMIVPLVFGVGLMILGMVLAEVEDYWRGDLLKWLLADAPVLVLYVSGLAVFFYPNSRYVVMAALIWYISGILIIHRRNLLRAMGASLAGLLEKVFLLAINTFSFLRVGAFALAHAGMSTAVLLVLEPINNPLVYWVLMIVCQSFVIALETLVVFVQTTRLVFFEFFIRFLRAKGRSFKALRPPSTR